MHSAAILQVIITSFSLQKDKNAIVCSGQCRDEAWDSYHKHECGQLDLLHSVGIGHLAVRTLLVVAVS